MTVLEEVHQPYSTLAVTIEVSGRCCFGDEGRALRDGQICTENTDCHSKCIAALLSHGHNIRQKLRGPPDSTTNSTSCLICRSGFRTGPSLCILAPIMASQPSPLIPSTATNPDSSVHERTQASLSARCPGPVSNLLFASSTCHRAL